MLNSHAKPYIFPVMLSVPRTPWTRRAMWIPEIAPAAASNAENTAPATHNGATMIASTIR